MCTHPLDYETSIAVTDENEAPTPLLITTDPLTSEHQTSGGIILTSSVLRILELM